MKVNFLKSYERDKEGVWQLISSLCIKEKKMEYKLLIEERSKAVEIQKKLNLWKHEYYIEVLAMSRVGLESLAVLIKRENKEERRRGDGC